MPQLNQQYNQPDRFYSPPQVIVHSSPVLPNKKQKVKHGKIFRAFVIIFVFIVLFLAAGAWYVHSLTNKSFTDGSANNLLGQVGGLFYKKLQGENDGKINLVLYGIGGENHDGGYLSDSILIAQLDTNKKQSVITSLPRDLVISSGTLTGRKINAAFAEGYLKHKDWNEAFANGKAALENVTGLSLPYAAVVDFQGFSKVIDIIGGVDVQIPETFTDYQFPDGKDGYLPPVTFQEGVEHMKGTRALIYARSRHAAGSQGSDFARSKRQQQIIEAVKTQILQAGNILNPTKLTQILSTVSDHVHTNMAPDELIRLYSLAKDFQTTSLALTPDTGLICPFTQENTGAYILDACNGKTRTDIKQFFTDAILASSAGAEHAKILLAGMNAFNYKANNLKNNLEHLGLSVIQLNYDTITPEQIIFYQVNPKPNTAAFLSSSLGAKEVVLPPPDIKINKDNTDIIIVLKRTSQTDKAKTENIPDTSNN